MRIKIDFEIRNSPLKFKRDYRRYFISFIKKVYSHSILKRIHLKKEYRPYTFSVWFGKNWEMDENHIQVEKNLSLIFSSGDPEVITNFYNGAIELKKKDEPSLSFKGASLYISHISLLPYRKINSERILFKTMGVCVLNNPRASKKDFKKWYIIPTDDPSTFNECLSERTLERYQFITGRKDTYSLKLIPFYESSIREAIVEHYSEEDRKKGYVRGFRGVFWLEGEPEILRFVYDYGLGIRTGQGFGLLEIVRES